MDVSRVVGVDVGRRRKVRVGRGSGSGLGKTSGRGEKGQKSRSGFSRKVGFEGGQMPLHRRVPKRGFHNIFRKEYAEVNLERLEAFDAGTIVTPELLIERGIVRKLRDGVKILAKGSLTRALTVKAHKFSAKSKRNCPRLDSPAATSKAWLRMRWTLTCPASSCAKDSVGTLPAPSSSWKLHRVRCGLAELVSSM